MPPTINQRRQNIDAPGATARSRQKAFHSAKDYEQSASQLGEVVAPPPDERRKAAIVVADFYARNELPREEIVDMLMMLGIHPDQPDFVDTNGVERVFNGTHSKGL